MINLVAIKDSDIEAAARIGDLDAAIAGLQTIAGIKDGGIAALLFSEMEDQDLEWASMETDNRIRWINRWIKLEHMYEDGDLGKP